MTKKQSKPAANSAPKKYKFEVIWGRGRLTGLTVKYEEEGTPEKKIPPEPRNRYSDRWYDWYYKYGNGAGVHDRLIHTYMGQSETCCGFQELGGWREAAYGTTEQKILKDNIDEIAAQWAEKLKGHKWYFCTYIPNTKRYEVYKELVKKAGFVEGVSVKTTHAGRYTNTRWEFFPSVPVRKRNAKKTVPAGNV